MNVQTKLSAKGQVVIPKDVRDRLGWPQGSKLDVIETSDSVTFRKPHERKTLTFEEATAKIRAIVNYKGPRISDEEIASVGPAMAAERYRRISGDSDA